MAELIVSDIIKKVEELPALPQVMNRVVMLTSEPRTTVPELADAITQDQVITAKVLKLANSVYYGYARKIFDIKEAIMVLGFNTVRNLVMAASVSGVMNRELDGYSMPKGELWKHSISTAFIARSLAYKTDPSLSERSFIAGLLHDIGKVILNTYVKNSFAKVIDKVEKDNIPFMDAEREVLGFDHSEVGARVAQRWNLPEELIEAIACHHMPSRAKSDSKLVSLVHIADAVSLSLGAGLGGDGLMYPFDGFAIDQINLSGAVLEETISDIIDTMFDEQALAVE